MIQRFEQFNITEEMLEVFLNSFGTVNESSNNDETNSVLKKIINDLKLNVKLIGTFGFGIGAILPVASKIIKNMNISSIELNKETLCLLLLTAFSIIYLEEKNVKDSQKMTKDSKSMLEELRMRGIGDGIVKKFIKSLQSIKNLFKIIGKHLGAVVNGFMDMFAYSSLLLAIMPALSQVIDKFSLNIETLPKNFFALSMGIGTLISKYGISYIMKKLGHKFNLSKNVEDDVNREIETPTITKTGMDHFIDLETDQDGDLIKEQ